MNQSTLMPIMIFMTSYYPDLNRYSRTTAKPFLIHKIFCLFLLPFLLMISACTEKSTIIGVNLLPEVDFTNLQSTDTILARTINLYTDSVRTTMPAYSYMGGLYDPYYGNTFCDFVSQLRLTQKWPGGQPTVDSVKLYLGISGAKGSRTFNPGLKLYEITEELNADSSYYSKRDPRAGMLIGTFPLGKVAKDTIQDFIVVLPTTFGEYLLRDTTKLNQESTENDFRKFFKGIYVTIESGEKSASKGSIPSIPTLLVYNPLTNNFVIRVFYHTPDTTGAYYDFLINDKSVRYNRYLHDPSTADPAKKINHINDSIMDSVACAQSFYGAYGLIKLQGLEAYKLQAPISVNKASLVFTALLDGITYTSTTVPSKIYLAYTTSDGTKSIVPDYYISSSFFGGAYNSSTGTYSFNLAAFVQEYLEGSIPKPEVEIVLPDGEYRNTVLKSAGSDSPPKFTLVYTRF
jgi:hypothetical protein